MAVSQCLIAPPYFAAGVAMYTMAHLSDKYRVRSPFIVFNGCLLLIGMNIRLLKYLNRARANSILKVCPSWALLPMWALDTLVLSLPPQLATLMFPAS